MSEFPDFRQSTAWHTTRPIRATLNLAALRHNYLLAKQKAQTHTADKPTRAWAVIKADAYGHGQMRAVAALADIADGFALLEIENAIAVREAGYTQPLLLLEGVFAASDVARLSRYRIQTTVHCIEQLEMLERARLDTLLQQHGQPLKIALKLNTGMNRLGFTPATLPAALARLRALPLGEITLMAHFADADGDRDITEQLATFQRMATSIHWQGPTSLANSAALLRHGGEAAVMGDWVRPGILLYGGSPFADQTAASLGLQPVMALESRIIGVQTLQAGDRVGYSGTFTAPEPMRIGIVACGYADGYPRHAPGGNTAPTATSITTPIAVAGQHTRTVGRVSMDMLACDLTHLPAAGIGSPVTLWGPGEAGFVDADSVATAAGTISYELFCAVSPRVPVQVLPADNPDSEFLHR